MVCRRELQAAQARFRPPELPEHSSTPIFSVLLLLVLGLTVEYGIRSHSPRAVSAQPQPKIAANAPQISMYSTSWCGACEQARAYLRKHEIPFIEYDVEEDRNAARRMRELNPRGVVPTIVVDDYVMVGFNAAELNQRIELASQHGS